MAVNHQQLGSVLLLVLIFCAVSSVFMLLLFETTILEYKMLNHYAQKKQVYLNYLPYLQSIEQQLDTGVIPASLEGLTHLQWVPDSLTCDETNGIHYYRFSHQPIQPDGASSELMSVYAIRSPSSLSAHPHQPDCVRFYEGDEQGRLWKTERGQKTMIPLSQMLPISKMLGKVIVGRHPTHRGTLLYILAQKKYHAEQVIVILADVDDQEPIIHRIIDVGKTLYQPLLLNQIVVVNDDEWLMLFDAVTGEFLRKEALSILSHEIDNPAVQTPQMLIRKPREIKRLIRAPTVKGWAQAEIDIDYHVLGRRTWHES